jgi:16S rRNA processing protein RimM
MSDRELESNSKKSSGSLENSEPEFLAVGKVGRTHGLRGELWMNIYTDFPERLESGKTVFIGRSHEEKVIASFKVSGVRGLIHFKNIHTPEEADKYKNQIIYVQQAAMPDLPDGEYYHHDLIGMRVQNENQEFLGILTEIINTGANDVYIVKDPSDEKKELLIPAIPAVVLDVNVQSGIMVVKPQEWA